MSLAWEVAHSLAPQPLFEIPSRIFSYHQRVRLNGNIDMYVAKHVVDFDYVLNKVSHS